MNYIKSFLFTLVVLFAFTSVSSAQLVVVKKPVRPKVIVVKPSKPGKDYVWIDGHWKDNGKNYVWVKGHWVKGKHNKVWIKGRWKRNRGGWIWVAGYWK